MSCSTNNSRVLIIYSGYIYFCSKDTCSERLITPHLHFVSEEFSALILKLLCLSTSEADVASGTLAQQPLSRTLTISYLLNDFLSVKVKHWPYSKTHSDVKQPAKGLLGVEKLEWKDFGVKGWDILSVSSGTTFWMRNSFSAHFISFQSENKRFQADFHN